MTDRPAPPVLAATIERHGPLPFSTFLEVALYDPVEGFYERGGRSGRRGDFLTSPEVGPLFGAVVARYVDTVWDDLGRPDPFAVIEVGAGPGTLARTVLAASPRCAAALRYVLVERSARQRRLHLDGLPLEEHSTSFFLPGGRIEADDDAAPRSRPGIGPIAVSLEQLPAEAVTGVVIANELLDNVPFDLLVRRDGRWWEVRIGLAEHGRHLTEVIVPVVAPSWLASLVPDPAEGARIPVQTGAASWLRRALERLDGGVVVILDYASSSAELAARPSTEWLRTYRAHERGTAVLLDVGEQDITCEVALDQLARVRPPVDVTTQAEWLVRHGIGPLVEAGRVAWTEGAARGDLAALRGRSRVREAEALLDPAGLGAFRVITWAAGPALPSPALEKQWAEPLA